MKRQEFERILRNMGFSCIGGSKHFKWSNGNQSVIIPFDREINRMLARRLLKEIGYTDYKSI